MRNPHPPPNHPAIGSRQPRCSQQMRSRRLPQYGPGWPILPIQPATGFRLLRLRGLGKTRFTSWRLSGSTTSPRRPGASTQKSKTSRCTNSGWSRSSRADAAPDTAGTLGGGTKSKYRAAIAAGEGVTGRHCLLTTGGLIGVRWRRVATR